MSERLILDLERFLRRARTASPDAAPGLDLVYAWIDGVRAGESAERNARPRERAVFDAAAFAAVEEGIACGLRRARKHTDAPTDEQVAEHVEREVLGAICEVFSFDEEVGGG